MTWKNFKRVAFLNLLLVLGTTTSCGVYSFSGVSVDASTITVNAFFNDALGGPPDLSQRFTNALQDYYQRNTSLKLVPNQGDLLVEGVITSFNIRPLGATQQNVGNQQIDTSVDSELIVSVKVSYVNINDETFNFEGKTFTQKEPFNNEQNFAAIEDQLLDVIFERLVIDIFNQTVANW